MTISRSEMAKAMLSDVITEWMSWPGELQTITGFSIDQYRALDLRLANPGSELEHADDAMMIEAAKQFFGYPGMTTASVEKALGPDWRQAIETGFLSEINQ